MHTVFLRPGLGLSEFERFFDGSICGKAYPQEGLICGSKKASEATDIIRQNENLYLRK